MDARRLGGCSSCAQFNQDSIDKVPSPFDVEAGVAQYEDFSGFLCL